jgi:hypothetical protein
MVTEVRWLVTFSAVSVILGGLDQPHLVQLRDLADTEI